MQVKTHSVTNEFRLSRMFVHYSENVLIYSEPCTRDLCVENALCLSVYSFVLQFCHFKPSIPKPSELPCFLLPTLA